MPEYEVTRYDDGNTTFNVVVEAPTEHVANLYAIARLERTPDGAEAVRKAVRTQARKV